MKRLSDPKTVKEYAVKYGVSRASVYYYARRGLLPSERRGVQLFVENKKPEYEQREGRPGRPGRLR
jgi:Zn-dependent peptidase ImmA (M78 family)